MITISTIQLANKETMMSRAKTKPAKTPTIRRGAPKPAMIEDRTMIALRLPKSLAISLKVAAAQRGATVTSLVEEAIRAIL